MQLALVCCHGDIIHFRDIVVSSSSGKISKYNINQDKLVELRSWNAHGHEAWIVTSDKWSGDLVYSGRPSYGHMTSCDVI